MFQGSFCLETDHSDLASTSNAGNLNLQIGQYVSGGFHPPSLPMHQVKSNPLLPPPMQQQHHSRSNRRNYESDDGERATAAGKRPKLSLASLIGQAILSSPGQKARLSNIYDYISNRYPDYYKLNSGGWQNSIRHNLTINKAFARVPKCPGDPAGKGSFWAIHPDHLGEFQNGIFVGKIRGAEYRSMPKQKPNQRRRNSMPYPNPLMHVGGSNLSSMHSSSQETLSMQDSSYLLSHEGSMMNQPFQNKDSHHMFGYMNQLPNINIPLYDGYGSQSGSQANSANPSTIHSLASSTSNMLSLMGSNQSLNSALNSSTNACHSFQPISSQQQLNGMPGAMSSLYGPPSSGPNGSSPSAFLYGLPPLNLPRESNSPWPPHSSSNVVRNKLCPCSYCTHLSSVPGSPSHQESPFEAQEAGQYDGKYETGPVVVGGQHYNDYYSTAMHMSGHEEELEMSKLHASFHSQPAELHHGKHTLAAFPISSHEEQTELEEECRP